MMPMIQNQDFTDELGKIIRDKKRQQQREATDLEKELSVFRSGSAPPTVEGSLNSIGGLFDGSISLGPKRSRENGGLLSEEEVRVDPAYVNYYYSNGKLNPRLPPPLLSKEDWRFAQRNQSLFSVQPGFDGGKEVNGGGGSRVDDWEGDRLIGLPGPGGLGNRHTSVIGMIQDDMNQAIAVTRHPSRPTSRKTFDVNLETSENHFSHLHHDLASTLKLGISNVGSSSSHTFASALGASLSRNTTPDPNIVNVVSASLTESDELASAFSGLNLSNSRQEIDSQYKPFNLLGKSNEVARNLSNRSLMDEGQIEPDTSAFSTNNLNPKRSSRPSDIQGADIVNSPFSTYALNGLSANPSLLPMIGSQLGNDNFPPLYENAASSVSLALGSDLIGEARGLQNLSRLRNPTERNSLVDPSLQYLRSNGLAASQVAALYGAALERDYLGNSYTDLLRKAYLKALISEQNSQYGFPHLGKSSCNYDGHPAFGLETENTRSMHFSSGTRNLSTCVGGAWHVETRGGFDGNFASSLLDEFKSHKTKSFELSEVFGHVVEFSGDQYGSRFIQQKLETATIEEKTVVFNEIMPQALSLMTDVFGNYVVQKFLEHGTPFQIRRLAEKLTGNVLALSLQMYGCRVVQKAIEVVGLDQKTEMVMELDGHIMRCVRDQNGNHVIQKCIECVPEDSIQFIISTFYDQVVTLSTHPYGCRVIQRVLEHCRDDKTQHIMMDEILHSICKLAQDQYGNYVVQHVLELGKLHERSAIVEKLTGQIVQMSQQKFASNVIEKCLTFGTPGERKILVNEMLGSTDENEPLQVMMKDQFGNYVVQKVLETCDDQQLELVLNRIKVHLNALKKYTYGKHIVARVEKLVAAGERRISLMSLKPMLDKP